VDNTIPEEKPQGLIKKTKKSQSNARGSQSSDEGKKPPLKKKLLGPKSKRAKAEAAN